jgi:hypothetical protein
MSDILDEMLGSGATSSLHVGDAVRVAMDGPMGMPVEGVVRVLQDVPGKTVGVELNQLTDYAHSLDGVVEERFDAERNITIGKGWWTTENRLEKI